MAKKNEEVGGFLNYESVDVAGEALGIVYGILDWMQMMLAQALNLVISIVNAAMRLAGF
ncbi:MAG: Uncharacterised protein [SAR116 cluster bacterium MED-G04]|jgi:hypothetical protein|nr:MAG: Uncharacterised protein [SAR116 cluster bacterium MED-G04]|tara:strand:- start:534 stop:710 length:177 start_codon:yes stop_codon:yes gene_type:complete